MKYVNPVWHYSGEGRDYRNEKEALLGPVSKQQRSPSPGDPSLKGDLAKAIEESRVLKAVVVPLEKVCYTSQCGEGVRTCTVSP